MPQHPLYGAYTPGWKTLAAPFDTYEINEYGKVRNRKTQHIMKERRHTVLFRAHGKKYEKAVYRLVLLTFFPEVLSNETVDHIDENSENHFVENLQWLTRAANTAKSNQLRPRQGTGARAKVIDQWNKAGDTFIQRYESTEAAIRANPTFQASNIRACANGRKKSASGFTWKFAKLKSQDDLPGEEWTTNEKVKGYLKRLQISDEAIDKYRISNKGRIINALGIKTKGTICTAHPSYRVCKQVLVHTLVWAAWGNCLPQEGEVICHDDTVAKDEDGCCSNAIEHLRVGTQESNMQESVQVGSLSKYCREIEQWDTLGKVCIARFSSVHEACRKNPQFTRSCLSKCANGKQQTAYQFTWRYTESESDEGTEENPCKRRRIN
jgi:hypothetical protein